MTALLATTAAAALAWTAVAGAAPDGILREDMTEQEVQQSIGRPPDDMRLRECGAHTDHTWPCEIRTNSSA
jgi:hypothetical protein